jgi:hypothetical protein
MFPARWEQQHQQNQSLRHSTAPAAIYTPCLFARRQHLRRSGAIVKPTVQGASCGHPIPTIVGRRTEKELNYTPVAYRTQASVLEWEVRIGPKTRALVRLQTRRLPFKRRVGVNAMRFLRWHSPRLTREWAMVEAHGAAAGGFSDGSR